LKIPETTLEDWKDWAQRHELKYNIADDEIRAALGFANKKAQEVEDQREENRRQHNGKTGGNIEDIK